MKQLMGMLLASAAVGGCASIGPASIAGGECKIFERPAYAVRGVRAYDQNWIDSQVEGGVAGCGWKRPARRPDALDAPRSSTVRPSSAKARGLVQRVRDRIAPPPAIEPVPYIPAPSQQPALVAPAPVRDRVDQLLRPGDRR